MMGFSRSPGGAIAHFRVDEATALTGMVTQLADLVEHRGATGSDAAIDRLFPAAYRESDEYSDEFRRFTEGDLADAKVRNAALVAETLRSPATRRGVRVELDAATAGAWLRTLTDLRLTLAERVGISRGGGVPDNADAATLAVYEWLGYLQETLVRAVDR